MEDDTSTTASASPTDHGTSAFLPDCPPVQQIRLTSLAPEMPPELQPSGEAKAPLQPVADEAVLVKGFAAALIRIAALETEDRRPTCFHAGCLPSITIGDYAGRIHKYFGCSGSCFVLALVYLDRLIKRHPDITIGPLSCHRLLITSMMVAAKFHDDVFYSNAYYAKIGGLCLQEINSLEAKLVKLLDWRLQVQPEEFNMYCHRCQAAAQEA